ncbi:MAG: TonB family protein [Polynucleobacter sp.]|nr:TonB family protein [Polynucleobacter sp.]MDZ4056047.1 TonB family protein [Polynucleobacter sp.]
MRLIDRIQLLWRRHPIWFALGASLLLHAIFLSFRWGYTEVQQRRFNTPLSVVLVNSSSQTPPKKAIKLAQADLQGGGLTLDQEASAMHRARLGAEARLEALEKNQQQMLSRLQAEKNAAAGKRSGEEQRLVSQLNALEAELAKRLQADGKAPRRAMLTASSTKAVVFASYYDAMRQKIEAYGSAFFPRANGRPLYGSVVLVVSVDAQGKIAFQANGKEGIEVRRSSGIAELDRQAVAIVRAAAPYGSFPPEMRKQIDVLDWVSTFDFRRDGGQGNRLELVEPRR